MLRQSAVTTRRECDETAAATMRDREDADELGKGRRDERTGTSLWEPSSAPSESKSNYIH